MQTVIYFDSMSPNLNFLHDIPANDDVSPYQVWF